MVARVGARWSGVRRKILQGFPSRMVCAQGAL